MICLLAVGLAFLFGVGLGALLNHALIVLGWRAE